MQKRKGGEIIAEMLKLEGVDKVFGIIDGTYFGFYSSLKKYGIDLISPRHETSAAHMAGSYARFTNRLGVCMASNGPGVANILPGLVVEEAEGNRVLVITSFRRHGIVNPVRLGTYQYFPQTEVISKLSKASFLITDPVRIPEIMRLAFRICYEGRPGVVHVDIPEDIINQEYEIPFTALKPHEYRFISLPYPNPEDFEKTIDILKNAKYPIIHFGSGVIHSSSQKLLKELVEYLKIPVTYSWAARSVLLDQEQVIPMTNITLNHYVRNKADVAIVLGSRLGETDWWGRAPYWNQKNLKVIQVDIDPKIIGSSRNIELGIITDIKAFLSMILDTIKEKQLIFSFEWDRYKNQISKMQMAFENRLNAMLKQKTNFIHPAQLVWQCNESLPENTTYVVDGGNTAIWSHFFIKLKKELSMISTYKFGMLGAGVSQAIGASFAKPDDVIVCLIGDGAMGFHPQEIETAVRYKRKIIYIVFCDKQWGMVKINQSFALKPLKTMIFKHLSPEENINTDFGEIDFAKLAESMGAKGIRINNNSQIKQAIEECLKYPYCSVIHADIDPVKHMWAPGLLDFKKMHLEPAGR